MINVMPVAYAVSYIFGTAGSAWIMSDIAPRLLGGIESVKKACRELEAKMVRTTKASNPASCLPPVRSRSAPTRSTMLVRRGKDRERAGRLFGGTRKTPFRRTVRIDGVIRDAKSDQMLLKGNESCSAAVVNL